MIGMCPFLSCQATYDTTGSPPQLLLLCFSCLWFLFFCVWGAGSLMSMETIDLTQPAPLGHFSAYWLRRQEELREVRILTPIPPTQLHTHTEDAKD